MHYHKQKWFKRWSPSCDELAELVHVWIARSVSVVEQEGDDSTLSIQFLGFDWIVDGVGWWHVDGRKLWAKWATTQIHTYNAGRELYLLIAARVDLERLSADPRSNP